MLCPSCFGDTEIIDTRMVADRRRRRRVCLDCGERFSTTEATNDAWKKQGFQELNKYLEKEIQQKQQELEVLINRKKIMVMRCET